MSAAEELTTEAVKPSPVDAQAILDADKQARAQEMCSIIERESKRLKCDLFGAAEIVGNTVQASVKIVAR